MHSSPRSVFRKPQFSPYIFCNFDTVKLQKMYGRNQGFLKTDHEHILLCAPELVNLSSGEIELYLGKEQQAIA